MEAWPVQSFLDTEKLRGMGGYPIRPIQSFTFLFLWQKFGKELESLKSL